MANHVIELMDANDALEKALVTAGRTVSTSWRIEVREIGMRLYQYLDELNGRLEVYATPAAFGSDKDSAKLRQIVSRAEAHVTKVAKPLRRIEGIEFLRDNLDEWTEIYLETAAGLCPPQPDFRAMGLAA